jgi:hypothetical protein
VLEVETEAVVDLGRVGLEEDLGEGLRRLTAIFSLLGGDE